MKCTALREKKKKLLEYSYVCGTAMAEPLNILSLFKDNALFIIQDTLPFVDYSHLLLSARLLVPLLDLSTHN